MKRITEEADDLLISPVKIRVKEIDFFFIAASMARIDESSCRDVALSEIDLERQDTEEF